MKLQEARAILKRNDDNYSLPSQKQEVLRGLTILAKYDDNIMPSFEHDRMWACEFKKTVRRMTREDVEEMLACCWFEDEDIDHWTHY